MKKWCLFLLLSIMLVPTQAREVEGVKLPDTMVVDHVPLQLNGAGVRTKLLFDIYVASLYTPQKLQQAESIIALNKPRRIQLTLLRKVDADTMYEALVDGLKNNLTAPELDSFKAQVEQMEKLFKQVGVLQKGEVVTLDMIPHIGLRTNIRGQYTADIPSDAFAQNMLKIWLGQKPVDKQLKQGLLGKDD